MNFKNRETGFTLVELLVVILIIGVLAAIAIPAFMNQRVRANTAALETDMKNVATAYQTWRANPSNDNAKYWAVAGDRNNSYVEHPEGLNETGTEVLRWHEIPELPDTPVSPGAVIEVVVVDLPNVTWRELHEEGEFCLIGSMRNSNYDYVPLSGMGASQYHRLLFFDSKLGGLKDFEEVYQAYENGEEISCEGHARRYSNL